MADDDVTYVQQALAGDHSAFERLVEKYQRLVFNLALRMLRNYDDAADVTQSVFLKVYEKLESYNPRYKFFSWLYRIAVNESLNQVQKHDRSEELDAEIVSEDHTPEHSTESGDIAHGVQEAVLELELNYRIVVVLKHFQDLSYEEIGQILDIPARVVKSRLFTARTMLRSICKRRGIV